MELGTTHNTVRTADTLAVWLDVAAAYHQAGYPVARQAAMEAALAIAEAAEPDDGATLMAVAARAAALDDFPLATRLLDAHPLAEGRAAAVADLVKRLAETGSVDDARRWSAVIADSAVDAAIRGRNGSREIRGRIDAVELCRLEDRVERRGDLGAAA